MSSGIQWTGLTELREELRRLPSDLANEAGVIIQAQAEAAGRDVQSVYPEVTGNLRRRVRVTLDISAHGAIATLLSSARHSHLYEFGTGQRATARGFNRGRMPAADVSRRMIPIVIRRRRIMTDALIGLVQRKGFEVVA